jgi:Peptidase S24-like
MMNNYKGWENRATWYVAHTFEVDEGLHRLVRREYEKNGPFDSARARVFVSKLLPETVEDDAVSWPEIAKDFNESAGHITDRLAAGKTVRFRPHGDSMSETIRPGELCTLEPIGERVIREGDVVLCEVGGRVVLHRVVQVKDGLYQIGSDHHINGWVKRDAIHGRLVGIGQ